MRKFAMLSTALLSLASFNPSFAQPSESGPQPGLPPGASVGAPNAQQPRTTGDLATTRTGVQPAPRATTVAPAVTRTPPRRAARRRFRLFHRRAAHPAPAATAPAAQ